MNLEQYKPRPFANVLHNRNKRWTTLVCHRRAGKTVSCCADLIIGALETPHPNPQLAYIAPFRDQAKKIAWQYLKDLSRPYWAQKPNESELIIFIKSRGGVARIFCAGADNPDALRGLYFDGVVLDEVGDMRPSIWYSVLRPALSDRRGWAIMAGTPKGRNMFWNLREEARLNPDTHLFIEVKSSTSGLLHPDELRDARAQMTEDAFLREFECSFDASVPGAIWAKEVGRVFEAGQVQNFPIERELSVEIVGDLGYTDSCSWWVWQTTSEGYRVIDFYEANGQPISHYIEWIRSLPYKVADVWLPHDAKAKSLQTGRSMVEAFLQAGIKPRLVPNMGLLDGIEAARQVIPFCWFQETATYEGVEHLRGYSREWDEKTGTFRPNPKHDAHSHASDAFRYFALVARQIKSRVTPARELRAHGEAPEALQYQFCLDDIWSTAPKQNVRRG